VVRVLVIGPKVRGFKLSRGLLVLMAIKIQTPCCNILWHVKKTGRYDKRYFERKIHGHFSPSFSCFATRCILVISRELWWMKRVTRTQMRAHERPEMVAVHGVPCAIPPRNSNHFTKSGYLFNTFFISSVRATCPVFSVRLDDPQLYNYRILFFAQHVTLMWRITRTTWVLQRCLVTHWTRVVGK
jgi:hypothetical protein